MKKVFITITALLSFVVANAQFNLTTMSYSQDFNTLDTSSAPSVNLPSGWGLFEQGTSATTVDNKYVGGSGTLNAGNLYSFGTAGTTERALGSLASGSNRGRYGIGFTNNTGSTIYSLTYTFKVEQWRLGDLTFTNPDTTLLEYSTVAAGIGDTTSAWFSGNPLLSPVMTGATAGPLDGNLAANQATVTGTINITVTAGSTLYIRFSDLNTAGSDDAMAIDDLSITFSSAPVLKPILLSTIPTDNATNVAFGTQNLSVTFDKPITLGTGNVTVYNNTAGTNVSIPASGCTVAGNTVTIPSVALAMGSAYAVQFDSTCFTNAGNKCDGIYNMVSWNYYTVNPKPSIVNKQPFDNSNNVPIATTQLSMRFDKPITAGIGNIYLKNLTAATQVTYTVPSADVVISNDTVFINNVVLAYSTSYAVQFDSASFTNSSYNSYGIYNDSTWNFNTEAPPPPPVTSLSESFVGCAAPLLGGFKQFSVAGTATWRCSAFGHSDTNAVYVNGANATTTFDNTDWLISPSLDMSAMATPYLHFWTKTRFSGATIKEVYVSTNFVNGNPNGASWTVLPTTVGSDTAWKAINNTSLAAYKSAPFHIAFKYVSTAAASANAEEWTLDDINITNGSVAINNYSLQNADIFVMGNVVNDVLQLMISSEATSDYQIAIFDITGKNMKNQSVTTNGGRNLVNVSLPSMASGVYLVQVSNATGKATLKFTK
jgi:hypothetical protein